MEPYYHVLLNENEQGILIRSLNDERTMLMKQGKPADAVEDLLIKVGYSRKRYGRSGRRALNEER